MIPQLLVGIDCDYRSLKKHNTIKILVQGNLEKLPFKDCSFDIATSNMVFKHLHNPSKSLTEIGRILKPKGKLLIHNPNYYTYSTILARALPRTIKNAIFTFLGRDKEDVFTAYYKMNRTTQIKKSAVGANFRVKKIRMIVSNPQAAIVFPIVILELLLIKILMKKRFKKFRNNIIAILIKS